jgi:hypothetical protein
VGFTHPTLGSQDSLKWSLPVSERQILKSEIESDCYAYLMVTSERPLSEIEAHIGIAGEDRSWSKGEDRKPPGRGQYSFSLWTLQSGVEKGLPIDVHLQSIWKKIVPYRTQLCGLPSSMKGFIQCVGTFSTRRDQFAVSAGHFSTAAYYRLSFDCDFYFDDDFGNDEEGQRYWEW